MYYGSTWKRRANRQNWVGWNWLSVCVWVREWVRVQVYVFTQTPNNTFLSGSHAPCTLDFSFASVFDFVYWFLFYVVFILFSLSLFLFTGLFLFWCVRVCMSESMNVWMNKSFGMSAPVYTKFDEYIKTLYFTASTSFTLRFFPFCRTKCRLDTCWNLCEMVCLILNLVFYSNRFGSGMRLQWLAPTFNRFLKQSIPRERERVFNSICTIPMKCVYIRLNKRKTEEKN